MCQDAKVAGVSVTHFKCQSSSRRRHRAAQCPSGFIIRVYMIVFSSRETARPLQTPRTVRAHDHDVCSFGCQLSARTAHLS
jgi:hypothetical protein